MNEAVRARDAPPLILARFRGRIASTYLCKSATATVRTSHSPRPGGTGHCGLPSSPRPLASRRQKTYSRLFGCVKTAERIQQLPTRAPCTCAPRPRPPSAPLMLWSVQLPKTSATVVVLGFRPPNPPRHRSPAEHSIAFWCAHFIQRCHFFTLSEAAGRRKETRDEAASASRGSIDPTAAKYTHA